MRSAALISITIALVAAIGFAAAKVFGIDAHLREMMVAGVGISLVCLLAGMPMLLSRSSNQLGVVQAGLVSSTIHLLGSVLVAMTIFMRGAIATYPLLIWLASFYWTTLITLTILIAQQVRKAPAGASTRA